MGHRLTSRHPQFSVETYTIISRLCPVDYHRYHFPVCGVAGDIQMLEGSLRSVSPLALRRKLSILWENRRARTLVESQQFGKVLIMEVGEDRFLDVGPRDALVGCEPVLEVGSVVEVAPIAKCPSVLR